MRKYRSDHNKYDIFLFILIVSLCFGGFGRAFQIPRVLTILLVPQYLKLIRLNGCGYARVLQKGLIFVYLYMFVTFLWTPDKGQALKELFYYPIHFLLFLELITFSRFAISPLKSISRGWLIAVSACSLVAFWELTTGNHLSLAFEQDGVLDVGVGTIEHLTASVTFANYNNYNVFLCVSFPWIFYILMDKEHSYIEVVLAIIAIASSIVVIIVNASRGAALSIVVMLVVYYLFSAKSIKKNVVFLFAVFVFCFFIARYAQDILTLLAYRVSDGNLTTDDARSAIWSNVLSAFSDSYGFGVGIGGVSSAVAKYAKGGTTSPHNLFLEILVQYGIIITIVFIRFLFRILSKALKKRHDNKTVLLMAIIAFPIYTIVNSGYLLNTYLYTLLATMYVFANIDSITKSYGDDNTAVLAKV